MSRWRDTGARERLRRLRGAPPEAGRPEPPVEDDDSSVDDERDAQRSGDYQGIPPLSLGDLSETRRESLAARLRSLRDRRPGMPRVPKVPRMPRVPQMPKLPRPRLPTGRPSLRNRPAIRDSKSSRTAGLAGRVATAWRGVPLLTRQRIAAGAIVVAVVALFWLVLVPAAPCGAPGGGDCPPTDDAIALLPADALAYAHLDTDAGSDQVAAATALLQRLPLFSDLLTGALTGAAGTPVDFEAQIRSWAGGEMALAILPGALPLRPIVLIEADDADGARDFASGVLGPDVSTREVNGIDVTVGRRSSAALLDGFLLLGDDAAVSGLIDAGDSGGGLATSAAAAAIDDLPEEGVAYAYASGDGTRALLRRPGASQLDTFVDSQASTGVTAALSVDGDVARLTLRSSLDPDLAESSPDFFSALPPFQPGLIADVGPDALAYLGLGDPASSFASLLDRAVLSAPALRGAFNQAAQNLRKKGVSVAGDLLPLLGAEAALSVEPVAGAGPAPPPGVLAPSGVPYVSLLADGVDAAGTAAALADLQGPLADALLPNGGESDGLVSTFEPLQIAGIEAQTLDVSPNVQLTYATYDDRLAVATDPLGIAQARAAGAGLADAESFRGVAGDLPSEVSLLAYLDLADLISLGEQIGLAADPGYATLAPDLRALDAAAIAVDASDNVIRTDLNVAVGGADVPQVDAPPLSGD
ncbi:MAG: DUF3352 domain-containing protein [Solirubrobacterales bacterium]